MFVRAHCYEYIVSAVMDSQKEAVHQLGSLDRNAAVHHKT
jgi:hypothetical protein